MWSLKPSGYRVLHWNYKRRKNDTLYAHEMPFLMLPGVAKDTVVLGINDHPILWFSQPQNLNCYHPILKEGRQTILIHH